MNNQIFFFFYNLAHQSKFLDQVVVFFAVYFPYVVIFLAGVFLLMHHEVFKTENTWQVFVQKKKEILAVFVTSGFAWIIAKVLKIFLYTDRPFVALTNVQSLFPETGFAFPSGHATFF